jgi:decaprenylphospho-beta-D-erythro-pentofuranosid-2-ulose 2-reductase
MKKILIFGATSVIAEECARIWSMRGDQIFLVGRNGDRLKSISKDLSIRGALKTFTFVADLNEISIHPTILETAIKAMNGIDIVLVSHGTLSNQNECQNNIQQTILELQTNGLSAISLLSVTANYFEKIKNGTVAIISSVAGDRGRASNYIYGSAKAMVSTFASGLRQRLFHSNVAVVTIKPGFVDTPMTASFKKGVLWADPATVAVKIVSAIDKRRSEVYIPFFWKYIMMCIKVLPNFLFLRIKL